MLQYVNISKQYSINFKIQHNILKSYIFPTESFYTNWIHVLSKNHILLRMLEGQNHFNSLISVLCGLKTN